MTLLQCLPISITKVYIRQELFCIFPKRILLNNNNKFKRGNFQSKITVWYLSYLFHAWVGESFSHNNSQSRLVSGTGPRYQNSSLGLVPVSIIDVWVFMMKTMMASSSPGGCCLLLLCRARSDLPALDWPGTAVWEGQPVVLVQDTLVLGVL